MLLIVESLQVNYILKRHELTIPTNPDDYSSGHSVKRALVLLIVSIAICAVAMELVKMAAITIPLVVLVVIHALYIGAVVLFYRRLQLRAQTR